MEEGQPSQTAIVSALARAAHLFYDGEPKVLRDDLALYFSGAETEAALRRTQDALLAELARGLGLERAQRLLRYTRAVMTMRIRYAEDELEKALARGITQYVILGAGLDSFAYRRRDLAGIVRVFEVDHPATQQWKRARLGALNVSLPDHLTFVPINFERQTLTEGLRVGGHRSELPTFFSWLGVTVFLSEEAVFETLRAVAAAAPGSEIVFEYFLHESCLDEENRRTLVGAKAAAAARNEPWLSFFDPASLAVRLKALGFSEVWDFGPEEANARYFRGRTDGLELQVPNLSHLMKARVGRST